MKREEIAIRREKVKRAIARGASQISIAKGLGISERQVRRDIKSIKREVLKQMKVLPIEQILIKTCLITSEIIRSSWEIFYNKESSPRIKILCLRIVMDALEKKVNVLSRLGILSKEQATSSTENSGQISLYDIAIKEIEKKKDAN